MRDKLNIVQRRGFLQSVGALASMAVMGEGAGQSSSIDYPLKPVRIIVPFGAGGTTDAIARLAGMELSKELGQSFVVENLPGGSSIIGTSAVARSRPDGYTLLFSTNVHTINPAIRELPFNAVAHFTPISLVAASPNMLIVGAASPIRTVADYVRAARDQPGAISYSFAGMGTSTHIAAELFAKETQTKYIQVPYNSSSQVTQAVIAGDVVSCWTAVTSAGSFIKAGRARALAVANANRSQFAPDVPTFVEQGLTSVVIESWFGLFGPAGLPPGVAFRLSDAMTRIIGRADTKERLVNLGAEPRNYDLPRFTTQVREEVDRYTALARSQGIKVGMKPDLGPGPAPLSRNVKAWRRDPPRLRAQFAACATQA